MIITNLISRYMSLCKTALSFSDCIKLICNEYNLSVGQVKNLMVRAYYAQRFIDVFENNPNTTLNMELINEIFKFVADAA